MLDPYPFSALIEFQYVSIIDSSVDKMMTDCVKVILSQPELNKKFWSFRGKQYPNALIILTEKRTKTVWQQLRAYPDYHVLVHYGRFQYVMSTIITS